jgi:hypothetical protein
MFTCQCNLNYQIVYLKYLLIITEFWGLVHHPVFWKLENTAFRNLCLFAPLGTTNCSRWTTHVTTDDQSASPSWCQAHIWDPRPIFLLLSWIFLDSYGYVDVGRPLLREVGSVVFRCSWASPVQHFSGLSPTGLMTIFYCLYFLDSPNLEGRVPVLISPRNSVSQL